MHNVVDPSHHPTFDGDLVSLPLGTEHLSPLVGRNALVHFIVLEKLDLISSEAKPSISSIFSVPSLTLHITHKPYKH